MDANEVKKGMIVKVTGGQYNGRLGQVIQCPPTSKSDYAVILGNDDRAILVSAANLELMRGQ